jgi:hypothetical protein
MSSLLQALEPVRAYAELAYAFLKVQGDLGA